MRLFFDTETTGMVDFRAPIEDPRQPRLVQMAAILTDDSANEMCIFNTLIQPHGFEIPQAAATIHGVTTEIARDYGVKLETAMAVFCELARKPQVVVAHNIGFDLLVIRSEACRLGLDDPFEGASFFCTMENMTDVCKLPGNYGFKWPKLQEAHRHAFGTPFDDAHDALADVKACAKIYWWLQKQRVVGT